MENRATSQTPASAAIVAAKVRALSDEALCALIDMARWADASGDITEICQTQEVYIEIGEVLAEVEDEAI